MSAQRIHELLFEMSSDGIVLHEFEPSRPEARFLAANDAFCRLLGYGIGEVSGLTPYDVMAPEGSQISEDAEALRRRGTLLHEKRLIRKDGSLVPVEISSRVFEDGGRLLALSVVRDITERLRADEALRESEHRFRALNERTGDIVLVTDEQGIVTFAGPSLLHVIGVPPERVVGASCFDAVHPDDLSRMRESFLSVRENPATRRTDELRIRRADGGWALVRAETSNLLDVPSVRGMVINSRDVTEQRLTEEQLRQAQKLESIGRLAGGVAHDFNNLLTVILGSADAMGDDLRAGRPVRLEDVEEIRSAGLRASDLTRQLLAFARRQVIAPVPLDLNAVIRQRETLLARVLGADVELALSLGPELWPTRCDPGQLEQVILNLVVNARDAMPRGGRLRLATANVELDGERAAGVPEARPGEYVQLEIADSGPGLSPEARAHLFEPFFTTKPRGRGTGLGLATVYGIVRQSDGAVQVDSEAGRGTTVRIWLPRTREPAVAAEAAPAPAAVAGTETILVVEDDPSVREVTVRALRAGGYEVLVAATGDEALGVDAETLRRVRLLVTDVVMPGLDGRATARALVGRNAGLRVLYVSGYSEDAVAARGVLDGGQLLPKPFTAATLLARVRRVLDAREA